MVVLAGYRTVKEALVTHAKEFGDRDPPLAMYETTKDQGEESSLKQKFCLSPFGLVVQQQMFELQGLHGQMGTHGRR